MTAGSITANQFKEQGTLSGLTNGRALKISGVNFAAAITIHTATATANEVDYVTLYAENIDVANDIPIYLLWGNESSGDETPFLIPHGNDANAETTFPEKPNKVLIADNIPIAGGEVIKVFAGTTNKIKITGDYKRFETVT